MTTTTDVILEAGSVLKANDTAPNLAAQLLDESAGGSIQVADSSPTRSAADLTSADVILNLADSDGNLAVDGETVTVEDSTNGRVSYDWSATDTSGAGEYTGEFEVTFDDGEVITYPNDGEFTVTINEDLG